MTNRRSLQSPRRSLPYLVAAVGVLLLNVMAPSSAASQATTEEILSRHVERHPEMQLDDLYKLVHQAAMGSEHAVRDTAMARQWLVREIGTLGGGPTEPMLDTLYADSAIARVHLRPWLASGGTPEALLSAFVRTANEYEGSHTQLRELWSVAVRMAASGDLPFTVTEMESFIDSMEQQGFPAVHHSETYRDLYRPAYRVVALKYLDLEPVARAR